MLPLAPYFYPSVLHSGYYQAMRNIVLILVLFAGSFCAEAFGQSDQLYIQPFLGEVRINSAQAQIGSEQIPVSIGDTIETGSCSQVELHTDSGSLLLGPNSSLTIGTAELNGTARSLRLQFHHGGFALDTPRVQDGLLALAPNIILQSPEAEITAYHGLLKGAVSASDGTIVMKVFGETTIGETDGNNVQMEQSGSRIVHLRHGFPVGQYHPLQTPLLKSILDAIHPPCVEQALARDSGATRTDTTGISFCEGPGWKNCTERQRILEIQGITAIGEAGSYSPVQVRTIEVDGSAATPSEGWAISYSIYKAGDVSSPVKNTSGRLRYDDNDSMWRGQIRTPEQAGKYEVYLTLYCSRSSERCGTYRDIGWKETIPIEVVCSSVVCNSQNQRQLVGSYITRTESNSTPRGLIRRASGELVAFVEEFGDRKATLFSTVSTDQGGSWSPLVSIGDFIMDPVVTETATGDLIFVATCPNSTDWCFYQSRDGQTWKQVSVLLQPDPVPMPSDNRMGASIGISFGPNPPDPESIIQDRDGTYWISYMDSSRVTADIYVRQSNDLKQWSEPIRISAGQGINQLSRLTQRSSGTFALAYYSRALESCIVAESPDGVRWAISQSIAVGRRPSDLKIVEDNGQLALLLAIGGNVQMIFSASNGAMRSPIRFGQVPGSIRSLTVLESNRVLGAAFIDHRDERQDVLYTSIRALQMN